MAETPEAIYQRPEDYDLEHLADTDDIQFFVSLLVRLKPRRVLELAAGNGRVTVPLARAGSEHGFDVVGLEMVPEMIAAGKDRLRRADPAVRERLTFVEGDMRNWRGEQPFDVLVSPCSSFCHLLTLQEQAAAFRCAYDNLVPGGHLIIDVTMADLESYVESFRSPAREIVEIDLDTFDRASDTRMLRYKTTRYLADQQRARIRFLYDKFVGSGAPERSISDFESHVYYPRELQLLYMQAGFEVKEILGDYRGKPLKPSSPQLIVHGIRPTGQAS